MSKCIALSDTQKLAVSNVASVNITTYDYPVKLRVISDVDFYINVSGTDATDSDFLIPSGHEQFIALNRAQSASLLGSAAGNVWLSKIAIVN